MGDLVLVQFTDTYDGYKSRTMVDTLENFFANYSQVRNFIKIGSYQLTYDLTPVGNVGAGEDNLITYTIPANTFLLEGYGMEIDAWGIFAANANNKQIKLYLGSTLLMDSGAIAANNTSWRITGNINRVNSATESCICVITSGDTVLLPTRTVFTQATEDLETNLIIKCTGEATTNNDIVQKGLTIRVFP
jgi:hypothetical protein